MTSALSIAKVQAFVFRYPVKIPVRTSFGIMRDRPAVFVRVEDVDGTIGWGEAWCNFPAVGAEHRARLIEGVLGPLLVGRAYTRPEEAFDALCAATAVLAIQSGEPGPLAQAIAGIDIALWDLVARRARQPLWSLLGGQDPRIRVYASGINPDAPERVVAEMRSRGHAAFKLKVGFGDEIDIRNLEAIRSEAGDDITLAVDANQAWSLERALAILPRLAPYNLRWIEEPIRADRPWPEWRALAGEAPAPLAAGENILGADSFFEAIASGALRIVQPDVAKWGGVSGCIKVGREVVRAGLTYCPHYLGAGIGLLASAHLLAAVGGDGLLEIDVNENPLRDTLSGPVGNLSNGTVLLGDAPGLGIEPDLASLQAFGRTFS